MVLVPYSNKQKNSSTNTGSYGTCTIVLNKRTAAQATGSYGTCTVVKNRKQHHNHPNKVKTNHGVPAQSSPF